MISDLIKYRISLAFETLDEAKLLFEKKHYRGSVNRLYYSCFYILLAILAKQNIKAQTHSGIRNEFHKNFIKTDILDRKFGIFYSHIFQKRHVGDYDDFKEINAEEVLPLIKEAEEFILAINLLISNDLK